jgi:AraC-like DNA-binding protein
MSQTFYVLEHLELPFRSLAERSMLIAAEGRAVRTGLRKIVLVLGGECRHSFQNQSPGVLAAGDALIVPCRTQQFYQPLENETTARLHNIVLTFDAQRAPLLPGSTPALRRRDDFEANTSLEFLEKYFPANLHLRQILNASAMECIAQIRGEAEMRLPGFRWRASALCAQLVVQLARNLSATQAPPASGEAPRGVLLVSCAKEYLLQHLAREVHLQDVADHLHISSGHLARTFKQVAGQSLFAYFRQLRIEQAKLRLLDTQQTVTAIAQGCGFSSTTLFCRNFKQYTGMSPLAYRDEFGAKAEL